MCDSSYPPAAYGQLNLTNVDTASTDIKSNHFEAEGTTVPMKSRRNNRFAKPHWMTTKIKQNSKLKRINYNMMKQKATPEASEE